jgi:flagellar hook-associated protein 3 FlgL
VHDSLGGAITALNGDAGVLGDRAAALTATSQQLGDATVALKDQISNAQDVDMADTLTRLSATQTQLQASYQLMSTLRSLSLVNFLG